MKTLRIRTYWEAVEEVEVPDDYEWTGNLDNEWADQVDAHASSITDWELE